MVGSTHDFLLFFTDQGRVFHEKIYDLPEAARDAKGTHMKNLLPGLRENESVASVLAIKGFDQEGSFVFATKRGMIKKTKIQDYSNITSAGLIALNLMEGDELIGVGIAKDGEHVVLATAEGQAMRFEASDVRETGRATQGVIGIRLREDDHVISMALTPAEGEVEMLAVSECGLGKRTPLGEYPAKGRGGQGVITLNVTDRTGKLVTLAQVSGDEELMVLTAKGVVIRTRVEQLRVSGRNSQGVKVIDIGNGDKVISAFPVKREDDV